jgi:NADPH2 dehydrogenase
LSIPVITVNGIRTKAQAEFIIEEGMADFVALGMAHLVDPNFTNKIKINLEPISCLECKKCQWSTDGKKCPRVINT